MLRVGDAGHFSGDRQSRITRAQRRHVAAQKRLKWNKNFLIGQETIFVVRTEPSVRLKLSTTRKPISRKHKLVENLSDCSEDTGDDNMFIVMSLKFKINSERQKLQHSHTCHFPCVYGTSTVRCRSSNVLDLKAEIWTVNLNTRIRTRTCRLRRLSYFNSFA